jgi:dipeptidase
MQLKKSVFVVSIALVLFVVFVFAVYANTGIDGCTDIAVGKKASADGSVITSQTVDGRYDSRIIIVPAADHEPGEMAPVYEWIVYADYMPLVKLGEIPQVAHTFKYFNGAYPYANEHQVLIGETTLGGANETEHGEDAIMTIEQLEVFALQRAKTAREAIQIMGDLAVEYGYRASCYLGECLTVSDPNEVWVFEVFGVGPVWTPDSGKPGAVWCAQRVPDEHITCVPNMSRIAEIDRTDTEYFMVCDDYITPAEELGLYDPASGEPFIWRNVYGNALQKGTGSKVRIWKVYSELAPSGNWVMEDAPNYPFSIKPDKKVSFQDVIALFRETYAGTKYDMTEDPDWYVPGKDGWEKSPLATPQVDGTWRALLDITYYRPIARLYCSYFFVSQARDWMPDEIGGVVWFGLDNPENSPFVPLYTGINEVPESWAHLDRDKLDRESAWWAFGLVDDLVNHRYGDLKPELDKVLVPMQEDMFAMQESIEQTALDLYETSPELAQKFLTNYTGSLMNQTEKVYWDLVDKFLFELNNN